MHIPDNYLSPATCAVMGAAMIPVWVASVKKVKAEISKAKMPQLGIGAALAFLMMMFNVPLPGGTTGHAVGGTLIAILLGPFAACISVTVALLIQALLFGDGGILAFGANCFNMAFVLPFLGYFIYRFFKDRAKTPKGEYIGIALGSYFGIVVASLCAAVEFGLQPLLFHNAAEQPLYCPYPLTVSIPAMVLPHMLVIGFVEVFFTVSIYAFVKRTAPKRIYEGGKKKINAVFGLIAALVCLSPLGLLATGTAWGEWGLDEIKSAASGGKTLGFIPQGMTNGLHFKAFFSDYALNGAPPVFGYILSALIGAAIMIIVFKIISSFIKDKAVTEDEIRR